MANMNRWRNLAGNLTLLLTCVLLSLFFAEAVFRVFDLYSPPDPQPRLPNLFTSDAIMGYHLVPSTETIYNYPPDNPVAIPLVSNSLGFREDRELYEDDPRTRLPVPIGEATWAIAPSAAKADGLSTAFLLMSVEEIVDHCRNHPGVEAILSEDGALRRIGN